MMRCCRIARPRAPAEPTAASAVPSTSQTISWLASPAAGMTPQAVPKLAPVKSTVEFVTVPKMFWAVATLFQTANAEPTVVWNDGTDAGLTSAMNGTGSDRHATGRVPS